MRGRGKRVSDRVGDGCFRGSVFRLRRFGNEERTRGFGSGFVAG